MPPPFFESRAAKPILISKENLVSFLFALSLSIFIICLTKEIYSSDLKLILDFSRAAALAFIVLACLNSTKYHVAQLLSVLFLLAISFLTRSFFILQIIAAMSVSWFIFKNNPAKTIDRAVLASLIIISLVMFFAKIGLVNSDFGYNHLAQESGFIVDEKYDWGFWHFNTITSLLAGCLVAPLLTGNIKQLVAGLIVYGVVLTETISRTFLIVPIALLFYFISYGINSRSRILLSFSFSLAAAGIIITLLFIFPAQLKGLIGAELYTFLDIVLSLRLTNAENALGSVSPMSFWFGFRGELTELDSFFVSFAVAAGAFPVLIILLFFAHAMLTAAIRNRTVELFIIGIFLITANFEKNSGPSSLIFISSCIAIYSIYSKGNAK